MKTYECNGCDTPCQLTFEVVSSSGAVPAECPFGEGEEQVLWVDRERPQPANAVDVKQRCDVCDGIELKGYSFCPHCGYKLHATD